MRPVLARLLATTMLLASIGCAAALVVVYPTNGKSVPMPPAVL